jgi:hypothetical protein
VVVAAANAAQAARMKRKSRVVQLIMVESFGKRRIGRVRRACKLKRAIRAFGVNKSTRKCAARLVTGKQSSVQALSAL